MATKLDSGLIVHDGGTVKEVLDTAKPLADYAALRAYTGTATQVRITSNGISGFFYYDPTDTTSADNDGTIIVSGTKRWRRIYSNEIYAEWFGAKGNGSDVDTVYLNRLTEFCRTTNKLAKGTVGAVYKIDATLHINCNADFSGCTIISPIDLSGPVIKTSSATIGVSIIRRLNIKYPAVITPRPSGNVPTIGSVGIMLEGIRNSRLEFEDISGYETNLLLYSNDSNRYVSYCKLYFNNMLVASAVNVHMLVEGTGWINQCEWYGGQWAQYSSDSSAFLTTNLKISKTSFGGNNPPNGHTFFGVSMEGAFSKYTIEYDLNPGIVTSYFSSNTWINSRFEGALKFKLAALAKYDLFIGCNYLNFADFSDGVKPNGISTRFMKYIVDVAEIPGAAGYRSGTKTSKFEAGNTGDASAAAFGVEGKINSSVSASGKYQSYNPSTSDNYPAVEIGFISSYPSIYLGDGTAAPTERLYRYASGQWRHNVNLYPGTANTYSLGINGLSYSDLYAKKVHTSDLAAVYMTSGAGAPNGVVTASVGSIYTQTDGGANTTLWVKESGTGNAGWVAK